jgi:hypothetical protein
MTTNENSKTKIITITTAEIDFGDWKLTGTGQLGEYWDWAFEMSFPKSPVGSREWKDREHFSDREELEEYMWSEVQRLNQKYSHCSFSEETEEVENEDYYEEDED